MSAGGDEGRLLPIERRGLLSFYDRLRGRIVAYAQRRGDRLGPKVVAALLLAPDLFILLLRLTLDRQVPARARSLAGGALLYFVVPVDLLPEALFGPAGYVDDVVLAAAVLRELLSARMEPWLEAHWSGEHRLRRVVGDLAASGEGLLGENLFARVEVKLADWGIQLAEDEPSPESAERRPLISS